MPMMLTTRDVLLVVDMQNDFMPGGALAIPDGDSIVPVVNRLLERFKSRVLSRDWHPVNHISFSQNPSFTDKSWPPHCIQNTQGAAFHQDLHYPLADIIISKATTPEAEAYSAFQDTVLASWLHERSVNRLFITGLATDYCVLATALDAVKNKFETFVIKDACKGVDHPSGSAAQALETMQRAGCHIISSAELLSS